MKIERLLSIIIYLMNHQRVSAASLARRFEVSIRTIQRDIDTLTLANIPIIAYEGVNGGYELMQEYQMKQLATKEDYAWVYTALEGFYSAFQQPQVARTLEKVASLSNLQRSPFYLDFRVLNEKAEITEKLSLFQKAILDHVQVTLCYRNASGQTSSRIIEPVSLVYQWYAWYLAAYDTEKQAPRLFKLNRMENVKLSDAHCMQPAFLVEELLQQDTREYVNLLIHCQTNSRLRAEECFQAKIVSEDERGYIMTCRLPKEEVFWKGVLLTFGSEIEILSPVSIKEELVEKCRAFIKGNMT